MVLLVWDTKWAGPSFLFFLKLEAHFLGKQDFEDNQDPNLPKIPANSKWMPPQSSFPEIDLFLAKVRGDIFNLDVRFCSDFD